MTTFEESTAIAGFGAGSAGSATAVVLCLAPGTAS